MCHVLCATCHVPYAICHQPCAVCNVPRATCCVQPAWQVCDGMQAECSLSPPGSQVFERVNADGVYCSLITGQERKKVPFARHSACTIEMANLATPVEVAVVDEIQVGGD